MDQNYQPYSFYQEEQPVKNAAYYRMEARKALKGKWPISAIAYFLFSLITGMMMSIAIIPMYISLLAMSINQDPSASTVGILLAILLAYGFLFLVGIFLVPPLTVGLSRIYLDLIDGKEVRFENLFAYFKKGYGTTVRTYFLYVLLVIAAVTPAFIATIGAIIAGVLESVVGVVLSAILVLVGSAVSVVLSILLYYRYALVPFILAEYPTLRAIDVLRNSAALMKGNKWRFFCLQISFLGWMLLMIPISFVTCGIGAMIGQNVLYAYMYTAQAAFYHDVAKRDAANDVEFPSLDPNDYNPDADPNRPL